MYVIYASERSERAYKIFAFSHSKTAISLNILLVYTSDTLFQKHLISGVNMIFSIHIQSMQFPFITHGMVLYKRVKRQYIPTKH